MKFKHNQFIADFPETLKENPDDSGLIVDQKQNNMHRTNSHKGLITTNPNDMACMFDKYFEIASDDNFGESLAFVVAEMTSSVAKISVFCGWNRFKVHVTLSSVVKITFVETTITI